MSWLDRFLRVWRNRRWATIPVRVDFRDELPDEVYLALEEAVCQLNADARHPLVHIGATLREGEQPEDGVIVVDVNPKSPRVTRTLVTEHIETNRIEAAAILLGEPVIREGTIPTPTMALRLAQALGAAHPGRLGRLYR